jgi:hypothetical protein
MQSPDIWQVLGSPQIAEITALASIAISIFLTTRSTQRKKGRIQNRTVIDIAIPPEPASHFLSPTC